MVCKQFGAVSRNPLLAELVRQVAAIEVDEDGRVDSSEVATIESGRNEKRSE